jgi:leucyl aminopeptidase
MASLQQIVRWKHGHSFNFLEECNRWESLLADSSLPTDQDMHYLTLSEWDQHLERVKLEKPTDYEWLKSAPRKGVVRVPTSSSKPQNLLRFQTDFDNDTRPRSLTDNMADLVAFMRDTDESECFSFQPFSESSLSSDELEECLMSYLLNSYSFDRYKSTATSACAKLLFPDSPQREETSALIRATYFVQDLISTPAMDLTPGALQRVAEDWVFAQRDHQLSIDTVIGTDLLDYHGALPPGHGCGMIYSVGKAAKEADRQPRLIRIQYKPNSFSAQNKIALVGKGVTYDTGGLNLKPGSSMLNMKKDMGGAAHVLGLLMALADQEFPHAITVWIPAVENVISSESFRPGDVLTSVNGKTTEIGNTDAEGRLILADALALASAEGPDLIIDYATLTGAARVAMGTEIVPFFSNTAEHSERLEQAATQTHDPIWELPLWKGYRERITSSNIADLRNVPSDNGLGGAITAALYLQEFVGEKDGKPIPWMHLDVYGMAATTGIGKAQGLRSMYRFLRDTFDES